MSGSIPILAVGRDDFDVEALYGWFDRRHFDDDAQELVCVARKAGA